ncbi:hypothetical protein SSX86_014762 [Deinandra increscens subsp. villosa]|uniref:F-box associated beta-propeller type 1 domain-containing protein n=1 Tax=Deinandra increscens subsp. villosa TaxID=3103831 RepID=A0AAP0DA35_9ASTR
MCRFIWGSCNGLVLAEDETVSISYLDGPDLFVSVYSLRSNSWKKLRNYPFDGDLPNVVLVNENLNWLTSPHANGSPPTLLAFSLATEEFKEIELPSSGSIQHDIAVLFAVDGKLGVFGAVQVVNESWVMEEYGVAGSWTKLGIDGLDTGCHDMHYYFFVEGINGDIIVQDEDLVVVYNMEERRCRKNLSYQISQNQVKMGGSMTLFSIFGSSLLMCELPAKRRIADQETTSLNAWLPNVTYQCSFYGDGVMSRLQNTVSQGHVSPQGTRTISITFCQLSGARVAILLFCPFEFDGLDCAKVIGF